MVWSQFEPVKIVGREKNKIQVFETREEQKVDPTNKKKVGSFSQVRTF